MTASKRFKGFCATLLPVVALASSGLSTGPAGVQTVIIRSVTLGVQVTASDLSKVEPAATGMAVPEGSRLTGDSADERVQLECANNVTYTIIGPFDVVVDSKDAKRLADSKDPKHPGPICTVDLNSGTAVATTGVGDGSGSDGGSAAIIGPGAVAMISHHTQFGLSVSQQGASGIESAFVLDGVAVLTRKDSPRDVPAGSSVDPETNGTNAIDDDTYEHVADAYTALDLSEASAQGNQDFELKLQQRWADALKHFGDAVARVELSETQAAAGATQSAIFYYELKRAAQLAKSSGSKELIDRVQVLRRKFGDLPLKPSLALPSPPVIKSVS